MKSINLTEGNVKKVLLSFAIPFFIANAMQAAYGAVDLFTVGMFCTTSAEVEEMIRLRLAERDSTI